MQSNHRLIFNFHGLGTPPGHVPPEEITYWLPVDFFLEILDFLTPFPNVQLTFDDGNMSDYEIALPAVTERGLRVEFFPLASRISQAGYLGPSQIRDMVAAGMEVGLHGMDHRSWAQCDAVQLEVEIDEARCQIEAVTGRSVTRAACPFGAYNARCLRKLKRSGFDLVYSSDGGMARAGEWLQCRNTLQSHHQIEDVKALVERPAKDLRGMSRRFRTLVKRIR